jgi:hypothetical protein
LDLNNNLLSPAPRHPPPQMVDPHTPILSALRLAASEVALAGSFKKIAKIVVGGTGARRRCSSASGGRSPRAAALRRGPPRPRAAVTAHRLSVGSSAGSFLSDGGRSSLGAEDASSLCGASDMSPASDGLSSADSHCFSFDGSAPSEAAGSSVRGSGCGEGVASSEDGTPRAAAAPRCARERLGPMAKVAPRRASRLGRSLSGGLHA